MKKKIFGILLGLLMAGSLFAGNVYVDQNGIFSLIAQDNGTKYLCASYTSLPNKLFEPTDPSLYGLHMPAPPVQKTFCSVLDKNDYANLTATGEYAYFWNRNDRLPANLTWSIAEDVDGNSGTIEVSQKDIFSVSCSVRHIYGSPETNIYKIGKCKQESGNFFVAGIVAFHLQNKYLVVGQFLNVFLIPQERFFISVEKTKFMNPLYIRK